jgi:hypothetical protein
MSTTITTHELRERHELSFGASLCGGASVAASSLVAIPAAIITGSSAGADLTVVALGVPTSPMHAGLPTGIAGSGSVPAMGVEDRQEAARAEKPGTFAGFAGFGQSTQRDAQGNPLAATELVNTIPVNQWAARYPEVLAS